ncbi:MAG: DUF1294 domain-containing protein [Lachnospiraceae bacterium]|nr:DUF1294 domain-containing protein [Lachnospiraceae bacterium]
MKVIVYLLIYLLVLNLFELTLMGIDKQKAKRNVFRISEANLFLVAILGGSIGGILGMHLFHHKTRKWYFVYGMPAILVVQILLVLFLLFYSPIEIKLL